MNEQEYLKALEEVSNKLSEKVDNLNEIIEQVDSLREYLIQKGIKETKNPKHGGAMNWISQQSMLLNLIDRRIDTAYTKITFNN